ncbi:MAG: hypothetical protein NTW25_12975 [Candidatus Kapabacteria bacterium]|nr:hypothetical protein [Candidatus Kapabacteria bacterium]
MKKFIYLFAILLVVSYTKTLSSPSNFKNDKIIFLPNLGQYKDNNSEKILYKADYNGGSIYLKRNGISFVLFQDNKLKD